MNEQAATTVPAEWTDDCQGKKNYDGELVSLSTRYWPQGGGFWLVARNAIGATIDENPAPEIKPHANSEIVLRTGDDEREDVTLVERDFEGETFEEVKSQVEAWAAEQYARIAHALRREFGEQNG